jgi:hypothetical protein
MNPLPNLTGLRVGMAGTLGGIPYRVTGRVVLGEEEHGKIYFWQEFNLRDDGGRSATLVFEEGANGPEWKLFLLFDPVQPLTATEAATKRVGDLVNVENRPVEVTFVGQSKVYHIDGRAPEGEEVGDVANYLNADEGPQMLVLSWTGNEIEFYRGMDVPREDVQRAFSLPNVMPMPSSGAFYESSQDATPASSGLIGKIAMAIIIAVIGFVTYWNWQTNRLTSAPRKIITRTQPLTIGAAGSLVGTRYKVQGEAIVDIHRPGSYHNWDEYYLQDAADEPAALIGGLNVGTNEWFLFRPVSAEGLPSPRQAAALRVGDTVNLAGKTLRVLDLLLCRVVIREGQVPTVYEFGFLASSGNDRCLARWSEDGIQYYRGHRVDTKEVLAAFAIRRP